MLIFIGFSFYVNRDLDFINKEELVNNEDVVDYSIDVQNITAKQVISSPLELNGEVRGSWLFEASAPVVLTDWDGLIIAEGHISTKENWMTTDFVPFEGILEFEAPVDIGDFSDRGYLIFQKDNPSDLRELDEALEIEIRFR